MDLDNFIITHSYDCIQLLCCDPECKDRHIEIYYCDTENSSPSIKELAATCEKHYHDMH